MDICQWNYDEKNEQLIITDDITDYGKCSFEGLVGIFRDKFPDLLPELRSYINQYVLVYYGMVIFLPPHHY
jgi:hypothetical protein